MSNFRGFSGVLSPFLIGKDHVFVDLNLSWVVGLSGGGDLYRECIYFLTYMLTVHKIGWRRVVGDVGLWLTPPTGAGASGDKQLCRNVRQWASLLPRCVSYLVYPGVYHT